MTTEPKTNIERLIEKAATAEDSGDAMRFAQAAQNAAGALCGLKAYEKHD